MSAGLASPEASLLGVRQLSSSCVLPCTLFCAHQCSNLLFLQAHSSVGLGPPELHFTSITTVKTLPPNTVTF